VQQEREGNAAKVQATKVDAMKIEAMERSMTAVNHGSDTK
jgi:hypothetical protein